MIRSTITAAGLTLLAMTGAASAATLYATSAEIITDGPRGTADVRDNIDNAFGDADGAFFEPGYGAVVEFQFGTPSGQPFQGPGNLIEITFNNNADWIEAVLIEVGMKGDAGSFVAAEPNPFINTATFGNPAFTFDGVFDTSV
jgi:hypothetical protein